MIHSDFERGFIKAEIVSYDDLVTAGSMAAAKAAGKVRMEGKDYVMGDGDVVEFRHGATSKPAGEVEWGRKPNTRTAPTRLCNRRPGP